MAEEFQALANLHIYNPPYVRPPDVDDEDIGDPADTQCAFTYTDQLKEPCELLDICITSMAVESQGLGDYETPDGGNGDLKPPADTDAVTYTDILSKQRESERRFWLHQTPYTDWMKERFDLILGTIASYFIDCFPEGPIQPAPDPVVDEKVEKLNAIDVEYFGNYLRIAQEFRDHPLAKVIRSRATDARNAVRYRFHALPHDEDNEATLFEDQPLDKSKDASRLVVLHSGSRCAEIKCDLITLPLSVLACPDNKTTKISRYEALSYVWGAQENPCLINIGGKSFWVGKNLYTALVDLRLENRDRLLWIDALCINQEDIEVGFAGENPFLFWTVS